MKKERKLGQKISLFFSILSYILAFAALVGGIYWKMQYGTQDPIFASLLASVFFLAGCGVVLQVVANANLPDLKIKS